MMLAHPERRGYQCNISDAWMNHVLEPFIPTLRAKFER